MNRHQMRSCRQG
ncbi:hypothetical protein LINPERPRIM_LOCUS28035 [Linum perenne]